MVSSGPAIQGWSCKRSNSRHRTIHFSAPIAKPPYDKQMINGRPSTKMQQTLYVTMDVTTFVALFHKGNISVLNRDDWVEHQVKNCMGHLWYWSRRMGLNWFHHEEHCFVFKNLSISGDLLDKTSYISQLLTRCP